MKIAYVIELENGKFAKLRHDYGTHVHIDEVKSISGATHFDNEDDPKHYLDDFILFEKNGFGFDEGINSFNQYHGEFSSLKRIRKVQITYSFVDEIDEDQSNVIHDSYYDITSKIPTEEQIISIAEKLPNNINLLAEQWGWNDTEVREFVFRFIRDVICGE